MSDHNSSKSSSLTQPKNTTANSLFSEPLSTVAATPWYYQLVIKLVKPLYRVALWRRHQRISQTKKQKTKSQKQSDNPIQKSKQALPVTNSPNNPNNASYPAYANYPTYPSYQSEVAARFGKSYPPPPVLPQSSNSPPSDDENRHGSNTLSETSVWATHPTVWCHAVSLGETNTIAPMLQQLIQQGAKIWLTNTTQTGFARAEVLFAHAIAAKQMVHTFVPTDDRKIIRKFLKHVKPDLAMFVETELWANTLAELAYSNIPSVLVNGRLSQKSFENYQKFRAVSASMMQNISMIIAQDSDSAKRLRSLGAAAAKIRCTDSLKWSTGQTFAEAETLNSTDKTASIAAHRKLIYDFSKDPELTKRPIWVAGSTHEGEEQIALQAQQKLLKLKGMQDAVLIIVPRHPERFDAVAAMIEKSGLRFKRRSQDERIDLETQVYLSDTMGELGKCYALSDVCFVGGSLVNVGGHNPIEAAVLGKPVIMGHFTHSCHELVAALQTVNGLEIVEGTEANSIETKATNLYALLVAWLSNPDEAVKAGQQGKEMVLAKSGALQQQIEMVEGLLTASLTSKS